MTFLKTKWNYLLVVWIAFVFVQSLFFKFASAPESIYIFQTLEDWSGLDFFEPGLRYAVGTAELVASVLLFVPALQGVGALIALGIMTGAIFFHLFTPLGIEVHNDGGTLFIMACTVWLASVLVVLKNKQKLLALIGKA